MFSLRNSSSGSSSGSDEDSFGWWIGVETQTQATKSPSCSSVTSEDVSGSRALARDLAADAQLPRNEDAEDIEMRLLDVNEKSTDAHRRALCYTPERLIRSEDYRIVAPSPRFCPGLSTPKNLSPRFRDGNGGWTTKTMDDWTVGAEHLAALLRSSQRTSTTTSCRRCCCIWYGDGEVLLHTERCPRSDEDADEFNEPDDDFHIRLPSECDSCCNDSNRPYSDCCSKDEDQQSDIANDSSRISATDGILGSVLDHRSHTNDVREEERKDDDKQQQRRFSRELTHVTHVTRETDFVVCENQIKNKPIRTEVASILESLDKDTSRSKTLLLEDEKFGDTSPRPNRDCLTKLVLTIQPDDKFTPVSPSKSEVELELLRAKLEKIEGSNEDLYEEITLLRRDFMKDEWKVNHLSEDVNKLRNEVYELRYMDDLLKLLKGELERISKRNWPFAIGHTQHKTEEINLVV